jgi:hypothetical protein
LKLRPNLAGGVSGAKDEIKIGLAVLIGISVGIAGWLDMNNQLQNSNQKFEIYLLGNETNELVISDEHIVSHNITYNEIRLNQEGIDRVKQLDLLQKPFMAKLNNRPIFNGSFWSDMLCSLPQGTLITDILLIQNGQTDTLRIDPCYPPQSCDGLDERYSTELSDHFRRSGKLIQ